MTVTEFNINFDQPLYYPGQMITGHVRICLDKPKDVRGVELKIKGRAKCKWTESESYTDSEGKSQTRSVTRVGKESYLTSTISLIGGKTELIIGTHNYPFAVMLPVNVPSVFKGKYGGITYYGKAKIDIPLAVDKTVKNFFQVENPLNLNNFPNLKAAAKRENSKTFCCFCCASGPLTLVVFVPKTGFTKNESIPITIEIDNASNVAINSVKASLCRKIHWKAQGDNKDEKDSIKKLSFGGVSENSSKTWSENMVLDCGPFPNLTNCNIITITYKLEVEADPSGAHSDLEIEIPLTIGDFPFQAGENVAPSIPGGVPITPSFPQQVNSSMPGGFVPPGPGVLYSDSLGISNSNSNIGFNTLEPTPYSSGLGAPAPVPYSTTTNSAGSASYPSISGGSTLAPHSSVAGGVPQGTYLTSQPSYVPSVTSYPSSPYGLSTSINSPPYPSGPSTFNPSTGPSTPYTTNLNGSNSVMYPHGFNDPNSPFSPEGINLANNDGNSKSGSLFNDSSINMPTSTFLKGQTIGTVNDGNDSNAPLLPSAPPAPLL